ncbi:MAG: flagellar biosynthetic protein FliR [Lachnospiraceae bacterium]|nr:flagellar biosynthetic protein FliR [Ruminococcus sp.]MCM1273850.1 flagellar biosynthetic protein FliR [Lachnospiraceae bacterium]
MSEIWTIIQTNFVVLIMVLARVTGIFSFNPIFSRRGVPNTIKAGASLMLAVVMTAAGGFDYTMPAGLLPFVFDLVKELLVGIILGFFVNLMLQVFSMAGEVTDMQLGLSMAKSYDPTFGNAGLSTQYYSYWFMLYFFAVGGHKSYIQLFAISYESIPMGYTSFNINILYMLVRYFEAVMTLGLKLAMPVIAASLISEFCVGVLMKAVPTIHVFVLNIQIKMLVGFVVLAASCGVVGEFMETIMGKLFENLNGIVDQWVV